MAKKYQVFISSTFTDLVVERQEVIRTILDLDQIPSGMEAFPAADFEQFDYIKKVIDECDYYILIIGAKYGSTDEKGVSYTELEYDYATKSGKVVLAFIHSDIQNLPVAKSETREDRIKKLNKFREKTKKNRLVKFWNGTESLKASVAVSLSQAMRQVPGVGWIRGNAAASEELLNQINNLRNENDMLVKELRQYKNKVVKIEGIAGLNDGIIIRYSGIGRKNPTYGRRDATRSMTWGEILVAVGPSLTSYQKSSSLSNLIERYISDEVQDMSSVYVAATDADKVKIQLIAMGLVKTYSDTQDDDYVEFLKLTEEGREKLLIAGSAKK
ncbi:DUF4062 domain-containing protein [Methylobacterium platani]|uniref:DUF4062 domain-containing protein n=1 Tax=Methylobacterium platani TaxID=427683 RepID=UPI0009E21E03|nr:DUF4062 domain-containing protein [Methylobacterium platani]